MDVDAVSLTVPCGLAVLAAVITFMVADAPVTRRRVEVFAARQDLTVTEDNCRQVIAYLAVTRRWRSAGVAGALTWYVVVALRHHSIGINIAYALCGWFLGALIAEVRVSSLVAARRAASLERRTLDRFLPGLNRWVLGAVAVICLALAGILAAKRPDASPRSLVLWLGAGTVLPILVALIARKILLRPQPQAAADVLAADDAIRRRSLRVLTASAITLLLYCVVGQVAALLNGPAPTASAMVVVVLLMGAVAVPVAGWRLAVGGAPT